MAVTLGVTYYRTHQADVNFYQGHHFFKKPDYNKAMPYFIKSLLINPEISKAAEELGYTYLWTGRLGGGIEGFKKLIAKHPTSQVLKINLARLFSWKKMYNEAIALLTEAIQKDPKLHSVARSLAEIYIWNNQYDKALPVLENLRAQNPADSEVRAIYARALHEADQAAKADLGPSPDMVTDENQEPMVASWID